MSYSVRVVAKHHLSLKKIPFKLLELSNERQLTWGVIKFLILKYIFNQHKLKSYDWDIDGYIYNEKAGVAFDVTDTIKNHSMIVYKRVPLSYKEKILFIPYAAMEFARDIDEQKVLVEYY